MVKSAVKFETPFAITGYSHRLPGGLRTDNDFWNLLSQREIVQEPVCNRYGKGYQPVGSESGTSRLASPYEGLLCDEDELLFDRSLFEISQFEMLNMNPQLRMLLNCAWEVNERAGWNFHKLRNSLTGVFIGAQIPAIANWRPRFGANEYSILSSSLALLANHVSYHFNLMGPSTTYCTACSAGVSALHAALHALASGDCEQAIVGSVTYLGSARQSCGFTNLGVISPDGKCNSFDANANGYMRSEGCVVFAVKPLQAAENDGDHIFALIESTAVNAAGAADHAQGLARGRYITAPTRHSQTSLMRTAIARANRKPEDFDYVEAHATGTVVGDRIEGNAISDSFSSTERREPLRLSSVKSNIGHLEAAAFHASLLKVVLMMNRRTYAPISRNFFEPNPEIDFRSCPIQIQTDCEPFSDKPAVVGINSFGIGGANGHCVVTEYRPDRKRLWSVPLAPAAGHMIPLAARTPDALVKSASGLREFLESETLDLYTLAGNLALRRTHFAARTYFSAFSQQQLLEQLRDFEDKRDELISVSQNFSAPRIAMIFAGQGTQWAGCGRLLYNANPVFKRVIDAIEECWREHADFSLREACFFASQEQLDEVRLAQPVIFAIQCALLEILKTWGVHPQLVVGHSSGEVAAAYASGALSLADATQLVFHRSRLQQKTAGSGRMLAVSIDESGINEILDELDIVSSSNGQRTADVEIACLNSPVNLVVCGPQPTLEPIIEALSQRNLQYSLLSGNIAFHSSAMDDIHAAVHSDLAFLNDCKFEFEVPFVSSVTGQKTQRLDAAYWWSNIREPVNFMAAMETVKQDHAADIILEVSPHSALRVLAIQCMDGLKSPPVCAATLMRDANELERFNATLGELFKAGVNLDFEAQFPRPRSISHQLPGHPKEQQALVETAIDDEMFVYEGGFSHGPLVGHRVYCEHLRFEANLSDRIIPYLADHRVQSAAIMPAAGYIELILEALQGQPLYFEEIEFMQPCAIRAEPVRLQTALHENSKSPGEYSFTISSSSFDANAHSDIHSQGRLKLIDENHASAVARDLSEVDTTEFIPAFEDSSGGVFYERMEATMGAKYQYGPYFRTIRTFKINRVTRDFLIDVEMDEHLWDTGKAEGYILCPPLIDGGLQIFLYNLMWTTDLLPIPRRAKNVTYFCQPTTPRITVHVTEPEDGWYSLDETGQPTLGIGERSGGDLRFYDSATGKLFMHMQNYYFFASNPNWASAPNSKHVIDWQPKHFAPIETADPRIAASALEPGELLAELAFNPSGEPQVIHAVEMAGDLAPEQTMLGQCVDSLSKKQLQVEYWLISNTAEHTQACYDAFHHHNVALRFATFDEPSLAQSQLDSGLLRNCANQVVLLHQDANGFRNEDWLLFRRLAVPGGFALISHEADTPVSPGAGWTVVRGLNGMSLLQAASTLCETENEEKWSEFRLMIGNSSDIASKWAGLVKRRNCPANLVNTVDDATALLKDLLPELTGTLAIDCFIGNHPDDPTGELACAKAVELVQALIDSLLTFQAEFKCRVNIVTQNAVIDVCNPAHTSLWGLIRCMDKEIGTASEFTLSLIDIGACADLDTFAWLVGNDIREREIAIRDGQLWAPRLVHLRDRYPLIGNVGEANAYRLSVDNAGQIAGLQMKTYEMPGLRDCDVEIEVRYAALNFRDIMVALELLPRLAYERSMLGHEVGMEASGTVRRVGAGVKNVQIGDQVLFTQGGCIANRVIVDENHVFGKPECLSMAEAASVASVYVTAYYALVHLGRIKRGDRVLIHSAMGGVGQAAIQLAKNSGAQIYATAGSKPKRDQLLDQGVQAVFDSHSHDWYDELMQETSGDGVDIVLNSLSGHHVDLCLSALRPGGHHLEIGKVDIYADTTLGLRIFRKNLRFSAIDIDRLMCDDPALMRDISESCLELLGSGKVKPVPTSVFEYRDYAKALRLMTAGSHQGKLVLRAPQADEVDGAFPIADRRPYFNPDATYLITGGFGGLGLQLLPYLVINGARHVTFLDRKVDSGRTAQWIKDTSGLTYFDLEAEIDVVYGDVSQKQEVADCIASLQRPLKGIFHLAGVLDDCLLSDLTAESIAAVFAPKAHGALHLHKLTEKMDLDHFVMFSSVACVFGNHTQSNYGAANAFMDGLAAYRRQRGLPALSYNLAGVTESGMASRDLHVIRMIKLTGSPSVSLALTMLNLDYAMRALASKDHIVTAVFERPPWTFDSSDYLRQGRCMTNQNIYQSGRDSGLTFAGVVSELQMKLAELCGHEEGGIDEPLSSFGLTSISVAELGAFIQTQFDCQVSALDLMTRSTCRSIAEAIIGGTRQAEEEQSETASEQTQSEIKIPEFIHHAPSDFAFSYEDHFPTGEHEIGSGIEKLALK